MDVKIKPSKLNGTITIPSSKSMAHRAIICASLAKGKSTINNIYYSNDNLATINVCEKFADITKKKTSLIITPKPIEKYTKIQIKESASTLRLLWPLLAYLSKSKLTFELGENLASRPQTPFEDIYKGAGLFYEQLDNNITVESFPDLTEYNITGKISSQFISGLILLLPLLKHDSKVVITDELESIDYTLMTINVQKMFGVYVRYTNNVFTIKGNQTYKAANIDLSMDYSQYSNAWALNKMGNKIKIENENLESFDPDKKMLDRLDGINIANIKQINLKNNPDITPALAAFFTTQKGPVSFLNVERLKYKETNRIESIKNSILSVGGKVEYNEETKELIIYGSTIKGGTIDAKNDHRIAMMGVLLSTISEGEIYIKNFDAVYKSYPTFLRDFRKLGLNYEIISDSKEIKIQSNRFRYNVTIEKDILNKIKLNPNKKYLLVMDSNTPESYANIVKSNNKNIIIYKLDKDKEEIKTLYYVEKIINKLLELEFSKSDELIALGGGTITDLVCTCALIYKRGINYISIPTTLLAMVDASVGSKVGINSFETKNVMGGFYPPTDIYIDTNTLKTLSEREINSGVAEMIKMAAISDKLLFDKLLNNNIFDNIEFYIYESLQIKKSFVEADEFDEGVRKALNFGHTYGHVLEMLEKDMLHGECVSVGMCLISKIKELKQCLEKYNLPTSTSHTIEELNQLIINDKKIYNNELSFVKVAQIGSCFFAKMKIGQ